MSVEIGLWIDDSKHTVLKREYFDKLEELKIDNIAVMLDTTDKPWDPQWNVHDLESLAQFACDSGISVVFTTWPYPNKSVLDAMYKDLDEWLKIDPDIFIAVEADAEFNWKSKHVSGFERSTKNGVVRSSLDLAGDYLVDKMRSLTTHPRLELTTFTSHTENGRSADVAPHMDRLIVQAYSVRVRPGGSIVDWNHSYGPGHMQKMTLDRTLMVPGVGNTVEIGCGLAAWSQKWPGHSEKEAMRLAVEEAFAYPVRELRYWSSKWVVGVKSTKTPYAAQFLRELTQIDIEEDELIIV